ncbi:MAG: hypothetical protein L0Y44_13695 [Phycisphaerales bacterium]|nr:hypothetical protein [Phycisphaerales bacterium]MCI0631698.1 hypothetical protein [Phycisphaerales bacterium]MCI0674775.1 hypothetical protein [Phycisphaerales bacterium]
MNLRTLLSVILFAMLAILSPVAIADQAEEAEDRQTEGMFHVIWMDGLLDDYNAGTLSQADLMRELWAERPATMNILYGHHIQFNQCFQYDLIVGETNGIIGYSNGQRVFFDTTLYLDALGEVLPGYERTYNAAVRANSILNAVYGDYVCQSPPLNNKCCNNSSSCIASTGNRCEMDASDQWCINGSTQCP